LPSAGAWVAAALFAVHPVHVEVVALSINQSETLVGILLVSATAAYVDWRRGGNTGTTMPWLLLAMYLVGCLLKESAIVLPGLLLAAELTLIDDPTPWRERVLKLRPWGLGMAGIAVAFLGIRTLVLHGVVGTFTAEGLIDLTWQGRLLTMLGVVPRWATLMFWPAHLQEDYSPGEIIGTDRWGPDQVIGALILVMTVVLLVRSWRKNRVAAFGILWFLVAIFPVSNVVVPTGIILAERTLFLPSVGGVLALGALVAPIGRWLAAAARPGLNRAVVGITAAVIACGLGRSYVRMRIWRDPRSLWSQSMLDAPDSWRVNEAFAYLLGRIGEKDRFVHYMRRAIALSGRSPRLNAYLANWFRHRDDCVSAGPLYDEAVRLDPRNELIRASQLACLLAAPDYRRARGVATVGRGYLPESRVLARIQVMSESLAVVDRLRHGVKITIDSLDPGLVKITGPAHQ
ncbi:MAG: tetratricopeptide repeat protein, partial [Gemmatimonadales bacterium]